MAHGADDGIPSDRSVRRLLLIIPTLFGVSVRSCWGWRSRALMRLPRAQMLEMLRQDFVRTAGASRRSWGSCWRRGRLGVVRSAVVQFGTAIPAESTLSFLGYGVPPPYPAWGSR
jgi:ABC-type dipeptide/oligopeptide/nickel transport system permease subunit